MLTTVAGTVCVSNETAAPGMLETWQTAWADSTKPVPRTVTCTTPSTGSGATGWPVLRRRHCALPLLTPPCLPRWLPQG